LQSAFSSSEEAMRFVVAIAFIIILGSLFSAFLYMMKDKGQTKRTVNALTVRIGMSIVLFLLIILSYQMGWIQSTGIR
jgi:heme/copper-type cytochrome/quinol oxidase subunit 4